MRLHAIGAFAQRDPNAVRSGAAGIRKGSAAAGCCGNRATKYRRSRQYRRIAARTVLRGGERRQVCSKLVLPGGAHLQAPLKIVFRGWERLPPCQKHFFSGWAALPPLACGFFCGGQQSGRPGLANFFVGQRSGQRIFARFCAGHRSSQVGLEMFSGLGCAATLIPAIFVRADCRDQPNRCATWAGCTNGPFRKKSSSSTGRCASARCAIW